MPGSGSRIWDYFEPGESVSGMTIIDRLNDQTTQERVLYLVDWECCRRLQTVTHAMIKRRLDRGRTTYCSACAKHARASAHCKGPMPAPADPPETTRVVIERGSWAGTYWHMGPLGPRWKGAGA